jgi:hypothetical protein
VPDAKHDEEGLSLHEPQILKKEVNNSINLGEVS